MLSSKPGATPVSDESVSPDRAGAKDARSAMIGQWPATTQSGQGPDAHGQAALLLVESLIHGLVARGAMSVADAVEVVTIAIDVKEEIGTDMGDSLADLHHSVTLLDGIKRSLARDADSPA